MDEEGIAGEAADVDEVRLEGEEGGVEDLEAAEDSREVDSEVGVAAEVPVVVVVLADEGEGEVLHGVEEEAEDFDLHLEHYVFSYFVCTVLLLNHPPSTPPSKIYTHDITLS